jgi:hypothetical protein
MDDSKEITWAENPFLEQVASFIQGHGWGAPFLLILEVGRPLAFLGGQFLWIAQPALSLILPGSWIQQTARLLEEPEAVDILMARLEEIA